MAYKYFAVRVTRPVHRSSLESHIIERLVNDSLSEPINPYLRAAPARRPLKIAFSAEILPEGGNAGNRLPASRVSSSPRFAIVGRVAALH